MEMEVAVKEEAGVHAKISFKPKKKLSRRGERES